MDIIIIIIILVICCCCCIIVGGGGYYYINYIAPNNTQGLPSPSSNTSNPSSSGNTSVPSSSGNTSAPSSSGNTSAPTTSAPTTSAPTTSAPTTPAPKVCNINPQALLGNRTCNSWSWDDERTLQRKNMPNYNQTGTVPPTWDCWYEPTTQCVSRDCLNSSDPTKDCPKHNKW
jgi:cytoskeletal protein RodZ